MARQKTVEIRHSLEGSYTASSPGVLENVVILGEKSLNPNDYPPAYMLSAAPKYEGVKCYLNHPDPQSKSGRKVQDVFGKFEGVTFSSEDRKMRAARFVFNPEHSFASSFIWAAEHAPELIGFSHNAVVSGAVDKKTKRFVAEQCIRVNSVDLVGDPGTTMGLFESHNSDEEEKEEEMKPEDVTLEWLRKNAPKVLESYDADRGGAEQLATLEAENKALKEAAAEAAAAAALVEARKNARKQCEDAKMPAPAISEFFVSTIAEMTEEARAEAITDRASVCAPATAGKVQSTSREDQGGDVSAPSADGFGALDVMESADFASLIQGRG